MALDGSIIDEPEVDIDSAAEALLKRWSKKPDTSATPPADTSTHEEDEELEDEERPDDEDEHHEEGEEGEEEAEQKPQERQLASDDHEVVIAVDGKEHRVAVKDLKRLFGQEASLTRKSQEVATVRQQAVEQSERHLTALDGMLKRAEERYKPYAEIDWALAAAKLPGDDYQQLKAAADAIRSDVDYYKTELDKNIGELRTAHQAATTKAADDCVAALVNPEHPGHIEGFNQAVYNDIRQYASSVGVPQQIIDNTYDPVAIKLIHKAMLYDKAQKTAVTKLSKAPRNVNKTPTNDGTAARGTSRTAMEKLRQSGDPDDAAAALLARWTE